MAFTTSIEAEKRICATCQYWQGERGLKWVSQRKVRVYYNGGVAGCSGWRTKRGAGYTCVRYRPWTELPELP